MDVDGSGYYAAMSNASHKTELATPRQVDCTSEESNPSDSCNEPAPNSGSDDARARALAKAHARLAEMEANGEKRAVLDPITKAKANPKSYTLAIAAKCYDCVGGPVADGGYRACIRDCPSTRCPLYNLRPYRGGGK